MRELFLEPTVLEAHFRKSEVSHIIEDHSLLFNCSCCLHKLVLQADKIVLLVLLKVMNAHFLWHTNLIGNHEGYFNVSDSINIRTLSTDRVGIRVVGI